MTKEFQYEHSSIEENNVPLGWGLKLMIGAFAVLCLAYGILQFHTDAVSSDAPSTTVHQPPGETNRPGGKVVQPVEGIRCLDAGDAPRLRRTEGYRADRRQRVLAH